MSQDNHENETLLWETLNQSWANLSNDSSENCDKDKPMPIVDEGEGKGKKRVRGVTKKGKGENGEKKEGGETSDHEIHIWTERERRKKMRNMFSSLHSLLPQLPPKADKSTIVDEAVNYIKTLQVSFQRLQKQKLERLQGATNPTALTHEPSVAASSKLAMLSTRETFMADQVSAMNNNDNNNNNFSKTITPSHLPVIIQTWTSSNVVLNVCGDDAQFVIYAPKKAGLFTTICCVLEKHRLEIISAHLSSEAHRSIYMIQARLAQGACDEYSGVVTLEDMYRQAAGEIVLWLSS